MSFVLAAIATSHVNNGTTTSQVQYGPFNSERKCKAAALELIRGAKDITETASGYTGVLVLETIDAKIHYRLTCLEQEGF